MTDSDYVEFFFSYVRGGHGSRNSHPTLQDCLRLLGQWMSSSIAGRVTSATVRNENGIKVGAPALRRFKAQQVENADRAKQVRSAAGFGPSSAATGESYVNASVIKTTTAARFGLRRQARVRGSNNGTSRGSAPWATALQAQAAQVPPAAPVVGQYENLDALMPVTDSDCLQLLGSHGATCDAILSAVAETLVYIDTRNGEALRTRFTELSSAVTGGSGVSPLQAFASDALCITAAAHEESALLRPEGARQLSIGRKPWREAMCNALRFVVTELFSATARENMLKLSVETVSPVPVGPLIVQAVHGPMADVSSVVAPELDEMVDIADAESAVEVPVGTDSVTAIADNLVQPDASIVGGTAAAASSSSDFSTIAFVQGLRETYGGNGGFDWLNLGRNTSGLLPGPPVVDTMCVLIIFTLQSK
jgi:hypothetical protein